VANLLLLFLIAKRINVAEAFKNSTLFRQLKQPAMNSQFNSHIAFYCRSASANGDQKGLDFHRGLSHLK